MPVLFKLKVFIASLIAYAVYLLVPGRVMRSKRYFQLWQKRGYHTIPTHYYEPIPDTRTLGDELWTKHSELAGVDMNERGQLELLERFTSEFKHEYDAFPRNRTPEPYRYYVYNEWFKTVDGEILYCIIRHFKPRRIIEVGGGFSTRLAAQAIEKNRPKAKSLLKKIKSKFKDTPVAKKAQDEIDKLSEKKPENGSKPQQPKEKSEDLRKEQAKKTKVTPEELMKKAEKYIKSGMKDAARQYLQRILDDFPDSPLSEEARKKLEEIEE